jgi:hypothetical protein
MIDALSAKRLKGLLLIAAAALSPLFCAAQAVPAGSAAPMPSRFEIYTGYGYLHPMDSDLYNQSYTPLPGGLVAGFTGYFNRTFGLEGDYSHYFNSPDYCFRSVQGGPVFRLPLGRLVPFAHLLGGGAQVGPSYDHSGSTNQCTWGWTATAGFGVDYVLPMTSLRNRLAIRPLEADFQFADANFGPQLAPLSLTGGAVQITAYRLTGGLVIRLGATAPPLPASFDCAVQPVSIFPGDPISVTGQVINLEPGKKLLPTYTWSTTGGRLSRSADGAAIATSGLAAGDYTVIGKVSEGSAPNQHAECSASFRVVAFQPPTIACSANPTSILPGGFTTITAVARSPQNRTLNYSYGTTAGQITGSGANATLAAADVHPGNVSVTCNVVDDVGNAASANVEVSVVAPPPPPLPPAPEARKLCSVSFERDKKRPVRVDNEAKGCLDDIALELNRDADAVLVVVGKHDPGEKPDAAAERTLNIKQYLIDEKGIDPSRVEVRTGETSDRTVDNILVPLGATWDTGGTTSFDPSRVERHGQPYAPAPK